MDLSFSPLFPADEAPLPGADMARLVAMLAVRREESATAMAQAALDQPVDAAAAESLLAPAAGAFSAAMAGRLAEWRHG